MSVLAVRRLLPVPVIAGLLLVAPACTDGAHHVGRQPAPSPSGTTTPASAHSTRSVPVRVSLTHVAGRLGAPARLAVAAQVRRLLTTYAGQAFLGGDYPRKDFSGSFSSFTPGAAKDARRDERLLTNADLGPTTRAVRLTRATAYVSVLAPRGHAAGGSAAVDWVFAVDRGTRTSRRVELRGHLLLTRGTAGAWRIFGYDLARSATALPSRSGS